MHRIELNQHTFSLGLAPSEGGCVTHFKWRDQDVLRPVTQAPHKGVYDARNYAAFPMMPFCGRIEHGTFQYANQTYHLPLNMPPDPHAIHGQAWQMAWTVDQHSEHQVILSYTHPVGAWPWAYSAHQVFQLLPDGLELTLSLKNLSETPMPAGMGWHPYFPRAQAQLDLPTTSVWPAGNRGLNLPPETLTEAQRLTPARWVRALDMDNCFDLQAKPYQLHWPHHSLRIDPDPMFGKCLVFIPEGEDFFCVEPISHAPNAVNSTLPNALTGLVDLAPQAELRARIRLRLSDAAS